MILLREVSKTYPGLSRPVVDDFSLTIPDHSTTVLLGSSGCGKTTVLRMIARLSDPEAGTIEIDGTDSLLQSSLSLRDKIGVVFQHHSLFPHMTAAENIALPLTLAKMPERERHERVLELLEAVGLNPLKYFDRLPDELSGGQQQRVSVARALALKPRYLLLDEPFSKLDHLTRSILHDEMRRIREVFGVTMLLVTHDIFEAASLGDQIAVMNEGRILQVGSAEELLQNPKTSFVRDLVSRPYKDMLRISSVMVPT
jgi:osmoprotectant transport system ATP-binding protein